MGSLQNILKRYQLEKWFQRDNLIILVLAGVLLVVIAIPTEKTVKSEDNTNKLQKNSTQEIETLEEGLPVNGPYSSLYEYTDYLERKLEVALSDMKGVGKVRVMITLEASEEQVVEKDEPIQRNNTTENDGEGGMRTIFQMDSGQTTVYEKQGTNEVPYITKTILPKISGILIVAEGAGVGTVTKNITEIAESLFDIEAHKVRVVPME